MNDKINFIYKIFPYLYTQKEINNYKNEVNTIKNSIERYIKSPIKTDACYTKVDCNGKFIEEIKRFIYNKNYNNDIPTIIDTDNNLEWRLNNLYHRDNGPAIIYCDGSYKEWWVNGKLHREDGPAVDYCSYKEWWVNGKLHREDGPAVEYHLFNDNYGPYKEWWINGKENITKFVQYRSSQIEKSINNINNNNNNKT